MISFSNATIQSVTHPPCKRTRPCAVRFLVAANGCRARPLLALQAGPTILFIVVWLSGCFFGSNAADTPHRPKSVSALIVDHYRLAACFRLNVRSLIDTWKGLQMQGRSGTRPSSQRSSRLQRGLTARSERQEGQFPRTSSAENVTRWTNVWFGGASPQRAATRRTTTLGRP